MKYPKINSLFKRDIGKRNKPLIFGDFVSSETRYLADNDWEWTEKVDGMNIRIYLDPWADFKTICIFGRTEKAQIPTELNNRINDLFVDIDFTAIFDDPSQIVLYGEGYGGKIQRGSGYDCVEDFILFDVKVGNIWLTRGDVDDIAKQLGIRSVPVVGIGTIWEAIEYIESKPISRLRKVKEKDVLEGVVCRPVNGLLKRTGERIIEKIKVKDFTQ